MIYDNPCNNQQASEPSGDLDAAERKTRRLHTGRTVTALGAQAGFKQKAWNLERLQHRFVCTAHGYLHKDCQAFISFASQ